LGECSYRRADTVSPFDVGVVRVLDVSENKHSN